VVARVGLCGRGPDHGRTNERYEPTNALQPPPHAFRTLR